MEVLLLVVGFVLLVKGADWFVEGSSAIARRLGIPGVVIGMTVVAFGTSAPEAAVSITAALQGNNGIAVGNVLGSNIFNLLVVAGLAAVIRPVGVHSGILRRDLPYSALAAVVLSVLGLDGGISRLDGILLMVMMGFFMLYTFRYMPKEDVQPEDENIELLRPSAGKSAFITVFGLACVVWGGQMVVNSATEIALALGVSQAVIGLTIVAIGTSLPELVTSAVAARKGESDIAMGNVVGSNIFNILTILSISAVINPLGFSTDSLWDSGILLAVTLLMWLMSATKRKITRGEGIVSILLYCAYTAYILVR